MHLGHFHRILSGVSEHFSRAELPRRLEACAAALEQHASAGAPAPDPFRIEYEALLRAGEVTRDDLRQPLAQQLLHELSLDGIVGPGLRARLDRVVRRDGFDRAAGAAEFRAEAERVRVLVTQVQQLAGGMDTLHAQTLPLPAAGEGEVGILLPAADAATLVSVRGDLHRIERLFRAINVLTGARFAEPRLRSLSVPGMQVFVTVETAQVPVWLTLVERLVATLEKGQRMQGLEDALAAQALDGELKGGMEDEIGDRVAAMLRDAARELADGFALVGDARTRGEAEVELRLGLHYLATRVNEGGRVEVNVGSPQGAATSATDLRALRTRAARAGRAMARLAARHGPSVHVLEAGR